MKKLLSAFMVLATLCAGTACSAAPQRAPREKVGPEPEVTKPVRLYFRWSHKETERLEELCLEGLNYEEIARRLNAEFERKRTAEAARYKLYQLRGEGVDIPRANLKWTKAEKERLVKLYDEGWEYRKITEMLNEEFESERPARTVSAVRNMMNKLLKAEKRSGLAVCDEPDQEART